MNPNHCDLCDINFRSHSEKVTHMNGHQQYQSTDNILVKQYTGKKREEIKSDPMICMEHQCVISKDGCKGSPFCGKFTKDIYMEIEDDQLIKFISETGKESGVSIQKILDFIQMDRALTAEVIELNEQNMRIRVKIDTSNHCLNIYLRLSNFKNMIRNKNGITVGDTFYEMRENRSLEIKGIPIAVKMF